ncbi:hypothetical protein ACFYMW_30395 [Streptomyces sp. NPDC006692]|uniref:hypothetical protein n=1 Tax=unclassified Streptomyces TaxID=2593676 RepID=UPI003676EEAA
MGNHRVPQLALTALPLAHILTPTATGELIGGNYTNMTSEVGVCIAAGGTLHLVGSNRRRSRMDEERLRLARETHRLLHRAYASQARELERDCGGRMELPPGPEQMGPRRTTAATGPYSTGST